MRQFAPVKGFEGKSGLEVYRWGGAVLLLLSIITTSGQSFSIESSGARVGASPTGPGHEFHQAEAFLNLRLPWSWRLGREFQLQSRLGFSAGWLGDPGGEACIGTVGPSLLLCRTNLPVSFEGGAGATGLSRDDFREKDFGELFQFTSYIGVNLELPASFRIGYRFQHMSNAGISIHNPGLNLHMLAISYRF